jgi:hypothetical protein
MSLIHDILKESYGFKNFDDVMNDEGHFTWISEKNHLTVYQSKKNPKIMRSVFNCLNTPM